MIQRFVNRFMAAGDNVIPRRHPEDYAELVKWTIEAITSDDYGTEPDPARIHVIDDGDYQGTLLFVIGATGYQPSTYWYSAVSYGSCSSCDTLQAIKYDYATYETADTVSDEQFKQYRTLALHIVQDLKEMP